MNSLFVSYKSLLFISLTQFTILFDGKLLRIYAYKMHNVNILNIIHKWQTKLHIASCMLNFLMLLNAFLSEQNKYTSEDSVISPKLKMSGV